MKAFLQIEQRGDWQEVVLIISDPSGLESKRRWVRVECETDTKAIGHALARLLDWMTRNTDV
jgi:hypothetical protein